MHASQCTGDAQPRAEQRREPVRVRYVLVSFRGRAGLADEGGSAFCAPILCQARTLAPIAAAHPGVSTPTTSTRPRAAENRARSVVIRKQDTYIPMY
jgi:hypothetical protein